MPETSDRPQRAIVCEDEAVTAARLAEDLGQLGYEVVAKPADGYQAVESATVLRPDLVLMDIRMPGMDGLEAARQIRQQLGVDPTIVVITAHDDEEFVQRAGQAGVEGYLIKPVSIDQLRVAIHIAEQNTRRLQDAVDEAEAATKRLADRRTIERAKGILMDTQGFGESEAYRRLQKQSQDQRRPMVELAEELIQAHALLSGGPPETDPESVRARD